MCAGDPEVVSSRQDSQQASGAERAEFFVPLSLEVAFESQQQEQCVKSAFSKPKFEDLKMEFKVKKESETLLEKMFLAHARSGQIKSELMPNLLRELSPDLSVNGTEVQSAIPGLEYQDVVDYDTFQNVMLHFLVKKAKKDSNEFAHKNVIGLADFETP